MPSRPALPSKSLVERADALTLSVGARITVSTLILACLLVIAVGASSLLTTLKSMDADMKVMAHDLGEAGAGTKQLITYMDSLPPTSAHMEAVVKSVRGTKSQVGASKQSITDLNKRTEKMDGSLKAITKQTGDMGSALAETADTTTKLSSTIDELNGKIGPLVSTHHAMLGQTRTMQNGVCAMNGSLAYVLRTLNYMTAPPSGGPFTVRVDIDKKALPPIPGVVAVTDPLVLYPRGVWPIYNEAGARTGC
jgi:hypothetical protein